MPFSHNPFGESITGEDILEALAFFDSWEERYKYIIELGKELPPMSVDKKTEANIVRGCQSQVWVDTTEEAGNLYFDVDSDAFIVKGLLALVMAVYNGKSPEAIVGFDIETYFEKLALIKHLSATRGNGIKAMVQRVQNEAGSRL